MNPTRVYRLLLALLPAACSDPVVSSAGSAGGTSSGSDTGSTTIGGTPATVGDASSSDTTSGPSASSTDGGSQGDSSSSSTPICGDGQVDGDEECDDGTAKDGGACRADCRLAFEVLGTRSFHAGGEEGTALAFDRGGVAWVTARASGKEPNADDPLVLSADAMGVLEPAWNPSTASDDGLYSIAIHPSGDLVVAGETNPGGNSDGMLARVRQDGTVVWSLQYDGSDSGSAIADEDYATDVAVNAAGEVFAAYTIREIGEAEDIRIVKYDEEGADQWDWTYSVSPNESDGTRDLVLAPNGDLLFCAVATDFDVGRNAIVGRLSTAGELLALETLEHYDIRSLALDDEGITLLGPRWLERRSLDLQTVIFSDTQAGFDSGGAITSYNGGIVVAGRFDAAEQRPRQMFVGAWSYDGAPLWSDVYAGGALAHAALAHDLAFALDGTLWVVGTVFTEASDADVVIRRYQILE